MQKWAILMTMFSLVVGVGPVPIVDNVVNDTSAARLEAAATQWVNSTAEQVGS